MSASVNAVVLAGGLNTAAMREASGAELRSLSPLGQSTFLERVVSALIESGRISEIVVVGQVPDSSNYRTVSSGDNVFDNILAGIASLKMQESGNKILLVASDIPFVSPESVDFFVAQALALNAALVYPIVPLQLCLDQFPAMRRTSLKIRDGEFTGGNMMLVDGSVIHERKSKILEAYNARKDVLRLGKMLGPGLLSRIVAAKVGFINVLTIARIENAVTRILGMDVKALICPYAEVGTDIDKADDYRIAVAYLNATEAKLVLPRTVDSSSSAADKV